MAVYIGKTLLNINSKLHNEFKLLLRLKSIAYSEDNGNIHLIEDDESVIKDLITRLNSKDELDPVLTLEEFKEIIIPIIQEFKDKFDRDNKFIFYIGNVSTQSEDPGYYVFENCVPFECDVEFDWSELESKIESLESFKNKNIFEFVIVDYEFLGDKKVLVFSEKF